MSHICLKFLQEDFLCKKFLHLRFFIYVIPRLSTHHRCHDELFKKNSLKRLNLVTWWCNVYVPEFSAVDEDEVKIIDVQLK